MSTRVSSEFFSHTVKEVQKSDVASKVYSSSPDRQASDVIFAGVEKVDQHGKPRDFALEHQASFKLDYKL